MTARQHRIKTCFARGYRAIENGTKVLDPSGKEKNLFLNNRGYLRFSYHQDGKDGGMEVHSLVAYQKFGEKLFEEGIQVRHLDGTRTNNTPENIALGTQKQNTMDRSPTSRKQHAKHAASFWKKHDHDAIRRFYTENDVSYSDVMAKFGISSKGTVSWIINTGTMPER